MRIYVLVSTSQDTKRIDQNCETIECRNEEKFEVDQEGKGKGNERGEIPENIR